MSKISGVLCVFDHFYLAFELMFSILKTKKKRQFPCFLKKLVFFSGIFNFMSRRINKAAPIAPPLLTTAAAAGAAAAIRYT